MNAADHRTNINHRKNRVVVDWKDLVTDAEALLRSTATYTGEEIEDARARLKLRLEAMQDRTGQWSQQAKDRYRVVSDAADEYAHDHPWKLLGLAAALSLVVGVCLGSDKHGR